MKKTLITLLVSICCNTFATGTDVPMNFYSVIVNNINSGTIVGVWAKNSLWWDNWGWCDGAKDSDHALQIKPGEIKMYCGGNKQIGGRTWSDTPRLQHEWWFAPDDGKNDYRQTYSEQWETYEPPYLFTGNTSALTRLVEKNDWNHAYDDVAYPETTPSRDVEDIDQIHVYTIINQHDMLVECYTTKTINPIAYYPTLDAPGAIAEILRGRTKNLCLNHDGTTKHIIF